MSVGFNVLNSAWISNNPHVSEVARSQKRHLLRWIGPAGLKGPWSGISHAIVPQGGMQVSGGDADPCLTPPFPALKETAASGKSHIGQSTSTDW